jgi:hypothetical protein
VFRSESCLALLANGEPTLVVVAATRGIVHGIARPAACFDLSLEFHISISLLRFVLNLA